MKSVTRRVLSLGAALLFAAGAALAVEVDQLDPTAITNARRRAESMPNLRG